MLTQNSQLLKLHRCAIGVVERAHITVQYNCADSTVLKSSTLKWPVTEAGFLQAIYHIIGSFYEYWEMWLFDIWFFVPILCLDTVRGFCVTKEKAGGEEEFLSFAFSIFHL